MHQTFYIDIDEEITSVIDRLKKSVSADNYFVIPKRAIFMQSIVNLKLLKREADKLKKQIIIVSQDPIGKGMAEKAGLEVRANMDGLETETEEEQVQEMETASKQQIKEEPIIEEAPKGEKVTRLNDLGSANFFYGSGIQSEFHESEKVKHANSAVKKRVTRSTEGIVRLKPGQKIAEVKPTFRPKIHATNKSEFVFAQKMDPRKERTVEKIFNITEPVKHKQIPVSKKTSKFFISFIVVCVVLLVGVMAYLFLPSASVKVALNVQQKNIDAQLAAAVGKQTSSSEMTIPLRVVEKEGEISKDFDATGRNQGAGTKAHGTVVLYNSFSEEPQQLIATTRLQTADEKVFRISKNVTIPGMTKVNGEIKPGAAEAEVTADQPGQEYNIDATTFTIPGFKDSAKFDKFSAKSSSSMVGGSLQEGALAEVGQKDLDNAKENTENALKEKLLSEISVSEGEIILDQGSKFSIGNSQSDSKIGDSKPKFNYSVQGKIIAMIFSKKDVEKVINDMIKKELPNSRFEAVEIENLQFNDSTFDFEGKTASIKFQTKVKATPSLDEQQLKSSLLGKDEAYIKELLSKSPEIKTLDIELFPPSMSKIPSFQSRVKLELSR